MTLLQISESGDPRFGEGDFFEDLAGVFVVVPKPINGSFRFEGGNAFL
jgi:hypothetical protein